MRGFLLHFYTDIFRRAVILALFCLETVVKYEMFPYIIASRYDNFSTDLLIVNCSLQWNNKHNRHRHYNIWKKLFSANVKLFLGLHKWIYCRKLLEYDISKLLLFKVIRLWLGQKQHCVFKKKILSLFFSTYLTIYQ